MRVEYLDSITRIPALQWDSVWSSDYPFTQHRFLAALENSQCTTANNGWQPLHAILKDEQGSVRAVMPQFLKNHSYGEYVFDWGWADAYRRYGYRYYPKLVNAIPFTPATGPRWAQTAPQDAALHYFLNANQQYLETHQGSSFHCLFPNAQNLQEILRADPPQLMARQGCQFHWFNQSFTSFDDFLETFNSRKRKSLKKERKKVADQNFDIHCHTGESLSDDDWRGFYQLYQRTYWKRSGHSGYLNESFFIELGRCMPEHLMMVKAKINNHWVAGALYFYDNETLYGRYWGALDDFDGLHFECCYYQGIDFAIQRKLKRFDPGAQGEHKIQRGFTPVITHSYHKVLEPAFSSAIQNFLIEESFSIHLYCEESRNHLPFREGVNLIPNDILSKATF